MNNNEEKTSLDRILSVDPDTGYEYLMCMILYVSIGFAVLWTSLMMIVYFNG